MGSYKPESIHYAELPLCVWEREESCIKSTLKKQQSLLNALDCLSCYWGAFDSLIHIHSFLCWFVSKIGGGPKRHKCSETLSYFSSKAVFCRKTKALLPACFYISLSKKNKAVRNIDIGVKNPLEELWNAKNMNLLWIALLKKLRERKIEALIRIHF